MNVKRKRKQVEKFRSEAQILVSTDCGAEGWNLQFARILINFDLPGIYEGGAAYWPCS